MNINIEENLLRAWMDMSMHVRGNRLLTGLSFNEIVVCSFLYRSMKDGDGMMTATDLCNHTKLLKSQLNKVLNMMEGKGLIERIRSDKDKRKIFLKLREESVSVYLNEHEKVMGIMHHIFVSMGEEKVKLLTELLEEAVEVVDAYKPVREQ